MPPWPYMCSQRSAAKRRAMVSGAKVCEPCRAERIRVPMLPPVGSCVKNVQASLFSMANRSFKSLS